MKRVNVTDFRNNISHYIELSSKEDIFITKNGETVAILSSPKKAALDAIVNLPVMFNATGEDIDTDEIIGQEILRRCGY